MPELPSRLGVEDGQLARAALFDAEGRERLGRTLLARLGQAAPTRLFDEDFHGVAAAADDEVGLLQPPQKSRVAALCGQEVALRHGNDDGERGENDDGDKDRALAQLEPLVSFSQRSAASRLARAAGACAVAAGVTVTAAGDRLGSAPPWT